MENGFDEIFSDVLNMANDSCVERLILTVSQPAGWSCLGLAVAYHSLPLLAKRFSEICERIRQLSIIM